MKAGAVAFPPFLKLFTEAAGRELGPERLHILLEKAGLSPEIIQEAALNALPPEEAVRVYADLQQALRINFGRGARGTLLRIGRSLWGGLLAQAPVGLRLQSAAVRLLPGQARHRAALEILGRLLGGDISIHSQDLDLMLVDRSSPAAHEQSEPTPICHVTQGLIQQCLVWFAGREVDVEETACRACGAAMCEFKILTSRS